MAWNDHGCPIGLLRLRLPAVTFYRRICGIIALLLFIGFQAEAMMPDQCDDSSQSFVSQPDGMPAPSTDGHLVHSCHCLHVHVAVRAPALILVSPAVSDQAQQSLVASGSVAPTHPPFRPPLV